MNKVWQIVKIFAASSLAIIILVVLFSGELESDTIYITIIGYGLIWLAAIATVWDSYKKLRSPLAEDNEIVRPEPENLEEEQRWAWKKIGVCILMFLPAAILAVGGLLAILKFGFLSEAQKQGDVSDLRLGILIWGIWAVACGFYLKSSKFKHAGLVLISVFVAFLIL